MRARTFRLVCLLAGFAIAMPALTQEGHPLVGSWRGDWGPSADHRNHVVIDLQWDGKNVTGIINPGPEAIPLKTASFDPKNWTVRLEVETRDRKGNTLRYVVEGRFENYGSLYHQQIVGVWSHDSRKGDFKISKQ